MQKTIFSLFIMIFLASPAAAQLAETVESLDVLEWRAGLDYRSVTQEGSTRAGEYEYLKSYGGGQLDLDWNPLPNRVVIESFYLNPKDYFGSLYYAYSDIVLFNGHTHGMYHNLEHLSFGPDDPSTPSPSSVDRNPGVDYAVQDQLFSGFIRFKTPDFPFHVYSTILNVGQKGTKQQLFMRGFTGGLDRVSQSRDIDWYTREITVGANTHLNLIEADVSHTEKTFKAKADKVLSDTYAAPAMTVPHNLIPDLESSWDTVKVHTTYSGRFTAAATYTDGSKRNNDSETKVDFRNAAGDVTYMPLTSLILIARYRHYDLSESNPDTATLSGTGATFRVLDSLSSKRDLLTGIARYRLTRRLTVRGEYVFDTTSRDAGTGGSISPLQIAPTAGGTASDFWNVASRTTKGTARVGADFRIMSRLALRAEASSRQVTNPAYASDPDRSDSAKALLSWSPIQRVTMLASYAGVREKRSDMSAPLAGGSLKAAHDQALGSLTVPLDNRSTLTASYLFFRYKNTQTVTYQNGAGSFIREDGVPYTDTAQVASLSATRALSDSLYLSADASRSFSKGRFRNTGLVAGSAGIAAFSDIRVVEDLYTAALEIQFSRNVNGELRYQERRYNDKFDDTQDGTVSSMLAGVSLKW